MKHAGWLALACALGLACGPSRDARRAPQSATATPPAPTADLESPPALDPEPAGAFPELQSWKLANGVTVWFVEGHRFPLVSARIVTRLGAGEPEHAPGAVELMVSLFDLMGAAQRRGGNYSLRVVRSGSFTSWDSAGMAATSHAAAFPSVLGALADAVSAPRFSAEALARIKNARLNDKPPAATAALNAATTALFGSAHPYGHALSVRRAELARLSVADLNASHRFAFRGDEVAVLVCGDTRRDVIAPILEQTVGRLPAHVERRRPMPKAVADAHRLVLVDVPNAVRAAVRIVDAFPGEAADPALLVVLNEILGAHQSGRMNASLRIEHGYTYGAVAAFSSRRYGTVLSIATETSVEDAPSAVRTVLAEMKRLAKDGATDEEIERAKHTAIWHIYSSFETTQAVTESMAQTFERGLAPTEHGARVARIRALGKAEIDEAVRRWLRPDRVKVVIAADVNHLKRELDDLNLGEPTLRDAWGDPQGW